MPDKKIEKLVNDNKYEFIHIESTTSTMMEIKNYLNLNNKNCIFLADQQTKGMGRRENLWHSPKGNIYCSISFNNFLKIKDFFLYSILIAVTIKMTLEKFDAKKIKFKWPNDLFYENKKFCGIISETFDVYNLNSYMIVGFGVNINSSPKFKEYSSTYVKNFCDIKSINTFLLVFFDIFFLNYRKLINKEFDDLISNFKNSLMFKNEQINICLPDKTIISGKFIGIDNDGSLQLETNDMIKNIYNGRIKLW